MHLAPLDPWPAPVDRELLRAKDEVPQKRLHVRWFAPDDHRAGDVARVAAVLGPGIDEEQVSRLDGASGGKVNVVESVGVVEERAVVAAGDDAVVGDARSAGQEELGLHPHLNLSFGHARHGVVVDPTEPGLAAARRGSEEIELGVVFQQSHGGDGPGQRWLGRFTDRRAPSGEPSLELVEGTAVLGRRLLPDQLVGGRPWREELPVVRACVVREHRVGVADTGEVGEVGVGMERVERVAPRDRDDAACSNEHDALVHGPTRCDGGTTPLEVIH